LSELSLKILSHFNAIFRQHKKFSAFTKTLQRVNGVSAKERSRLNSSFCRALGGELVVLLSSQEIKTKELQII
jgi:hypothetical protein